MESGRETEAFKDRSVLVVCYAGSDRSRLIAEELTKRGYLADNRGILESQNYITKEDLEGVSSAIFVTQGVKDDFKKNRDLYRVLKCRKIKTYIMDISEGEKEKAFQSGGVEALKTKIAEMLDQLGFNKCDPAFYRRVQAIRT